MIAPRSPSGPPQSRRALGPLLSQGPLSAAQVTLHATLCGQNFPKPRGGWILLSRVTTSKCLILPLQEDTLAQGTGGPPREWAEGTGE